MKVSIITVVLNKIDVIEDCIRSVRNQNYPYIEHIIIDGGSTDGTLDVIKKYESEISKVISEPDNGIYDAMNKGIRIAEGQAIGFLNADDVYNDKEVIKEVIDLMMGNSLDAVYGDVIYVNSKNLNKVVRCWRAGKYKKGAFYHGWAPPHPAFFCRKYLFSNFGLFNTKYDVAGDFELMLRFVEKYNIKIRYLPKTLVRMRTRGKANQVQGIIQGNLEIIDAFRLNGLTFQLQFFWHKPFLKISQFVRKPEIKVTTASTPVLYSFKQPLNVINSKNAEVRLSKPNLLVNNSTNKT